MKEALIAVFCVLLFAGIIYIAKKDKESKSQSTSYIKDLRLDHSDQVCRELKVTHE